MSNRVLPCLSDQIDRREFVARSATLAALFLAACNPAIDTAPLSGSVVITVANYAELANVGGLVRVNETSTPVALERTGASSFAAFSLVCPHQGATVEVTHNSATPFFCPVHGSAFNLAGDTTAGPSPSGLHKYSTVYDATAGTVTIS